MILFNALPQSDIKTIENYAKKFSYSNFSIGVEEFLKPWDTEKRKLYKLLGNKFVHEFKFKQQEINYEGLKEKIFQQLYKTSFFATLRSKIFDKYISLATRCSFWQNVYYDITYSACLENAVIKNCYDELSKNLVLYDENDPKKKLLVITPQMKTIKVIKKIVEYFNDEELNSEYEDFRIKHSMILNEMSTKEESIYISIHPMDYMTMSDNSNDWTSCMSWKENGCYRLGTLEMLNSNNTLVVYTKSNSKYTKIQRNSSWNSKTWRCLAVFTKHAIFSGKQYPYTYDERAIAALEELRRLAEENLNWSYEDYVDDYDPTWSNYSLTTEFMYNDFLHASSYQHYYMIERDHRNNKEYNFSYSGKIYCLECGERLILKDYDKKSDDYNSFICYDCLENKEYVKCDECRYKFREHKLITLDNDTGKEIRVCKDCYEDITTSITTGEELPSRFYENIFFYASKSKIQEAISEKQIDSDKFICLTKEEIRKLEEMGLIFNHILITVPFLSVKNCEDFIKDKLSQK